MSLKHLRVQGFRCLKHVDVTLHGERNYFFGANASGKTSLLEAVHFLSRGRSFRTRRSRTLIRHGCSDMAVFGAVDCQSVRHRVGASLGREGLRLRLDGEPVGAAETSRVVAVQIIDPEIHRLIDGGPEGRRRYLDWGVFHVEHQYISDWRRFRRVLGQRNAALKRGSGEEPVWTDALVESGHAVDAARQRYVRLLAAPLKSLGEALVGMPIQVTYRPGWPTDMTLQEALKYSVARDRQLGSTQAGPHRAELGVRLGGAPVREHASRGQQKLVSAALTLAQAELFSSDQGAGSVLLVDDPAAELDGDNLARFLEILWKTPAQLLVTGLSEAVLAPEQGFPVFHVEQGNVVKVV